MNAVSIQEVVAHTTEAFRKSGYTERSVREKRRILLKIAALHEEYGDVCYNPLVISEFICQTEKRYERGEISQIYYRFLTKTASYLTQFYNSGTLRLAHQFIEPVSAYYDEILDNILVYDGWSRKNNHSFWAFAKTYFKWLQSKGYQDLSGVNEAVAKEYLIDCASRMNGSSIDTARRALKYIFAYLFKIGLCADSFDKLFSFPVPFERRIKRVIPQDEIADTLNVIDRNTAIGKRDYATMLLAIVTGLRATDISNLKLSDIDWRNGEIRLIQSKTENPLALPLTADVGEAIKDYILNGRPSTELANVFLRYRAPVREITPAILHGQHNTYRQRAGLSKFSFHALRRTLGSNMVISGIPVTTVAQVLGHTELDSTRQYISLDTKHLKECALNFTGIEPKMARGKGGVAK